MILTYVMDIDETAKLTQGQGHKVKGQGHITIYAKFFFDYKSITDVSLTRAWGCDVKAFWPVVVKYLCHSSE